MSILEKPEITEWLDECRTDSTRRSYTSSVKRFFMWYDCSFEEFLKSDVKTLRHILLKFQNEHAKENPNTVNAAITAIASFLAYLDKPIMFRGKRLRRRPDIDSHMFSNGDLTRMFDVANTKEKALLALGVSLGWEISAVIELDRSTLQSLVDRAKADNVQFMYFASYRKKTGASRFGVLNPLALEWTEKWLNELAKIEKDRLNRKKGVRRKRKENRKCDRPVSEVFDLTPEAINKMLRRLGRHAGIVTTGRVHFHKIRGWVISGLSRAGLNEWQIKYLVGKAIPLQDSTYLQSLQQEIEERYPKAYEQYLNIKPAKIVTVIDEKLTGQLRNKDLEIQALKEQVREFKVAQEKLEEMIVNSKSFESFTKKIEANIERKLKGWEANIPETE
jgi:hypothetical protein